MLIYGYIAAFTLYLEFMFFFLKIHYVFLLNLRTSLFIMIFIIKIIRKYLLPY